MNDQKPKPPTSYNVTEGGEAPFFSIILGLQEIRRDSPDKIHLPEEVAGIVGPMIEKFAEKEHIFIFGFTSLVMISEVSTIHGKIKAEHKSGVEFRGTMNPINGAGLCFELSVRKEIIKKFLHDLANQLMLEFGQKKVHVNFFKGDPSVLVRKRNTKNTKKVKVKKA